MSLTCDSVRDYYDKWAHDPLNNKWIRFPLYHATAYLSVPQAGCCFEEEEEEGEAAVADASADAGKYNASCINVWHLEIDEPCRRQGWGKRFFISLEYLAKIEGLHVVVMPTVMLSWLCDLLIKRGYKKKGDDCTSMYKDFLNRKADFCLKCVDTIPECGGCTECPTCKRELPLCCPGRVCAVRPKKKMRIEEAEEEEEVEEDAAEAAASFFQAE